jgi:enediyne biosynthesis protein E4
MNQAATASASGAGLWPAYAAPRPNPTSGAGLRPAHSASRPNPASEKGNHSTHAAARYSAPRPKTCLPLLALLLLLPIPPAPAQTHPHFENIAAQAGLTKTIPNGGNQSKTWILETTGSGAAWIDYDNDGLLDAVLVSGPGSPNRLYHNTGKGKFTDVTAQALPNREGWGQGVCAGDYDNDGYTDLFITYWGQNALLHNQAGQRFEDTTTQAKLTQSRNRYNTGCAFLDYDLDGDLDLFVANYLQFDFETTPKPGDNPYCFYRNIPVACGPRGLPFDTQILYRNNGDGTFTDVSEAAGITKAGQHYGLGVLTGDFNNDGYPDVYVACDRTPSILFINQKDGTFSEEALLRGTALDENGKALSGMGAAAADFNGDGRLDIFRTNFSDERSTLYRNRGEGDFDEATTTAGLAHNTRYVGWGAGFLDYDNDTWPDLLLVNGHVFPEVETLQTDIHYRDRAILYHNQGDGTFTDVSESAGPGILEKHAARGAAFGDYDNDGHVEILINNQNEPPTLLKQTTPVEGNWIVLKLEGAAGNRAAIGARVAVKTADRTQNQEVRSGGSYLSQGDLRLHFGLGQAETVDQINIAWPSGRQQTLTEVRPNQIHTIHEPNPAQK